MEELLKKYKLKKDATLSDFEAIYNEKKAKLSEERFAPGKKGADAARKLTELEDDYREIKEFFKLKDAPKEKEKPVVKTVSLSQIEKLIENKDYNAAQIELDKIEERTAAWHYLQSIVYWRKNWQSESKKELEEAMRLDPTNQTYIDVYDKMIKRMSNPNPQMDEFKRQFDDQQQNPSGQPQQVACTGCDLCTTACLINLCCRGCRL